MSSDEPPVLTVEQGDAVARNELGEDGRYHTRIALQVVGDVPPSKIEVVVSGQIRRVLLRYADGGTAICAGGSGPESAGCTLQNPPPDGHVVVDIATDTPLEGPISLEARAWYHGAPELPPGFYASGSLGECRERSQAMVWSRSYHPRKATQRY